MGEEARRGDVAGRGNSTCEGSRGRRQWVCLQATHGERPDVRGKQTGRRKATGKTELSLVSDRESMRA